MGHWPLSLTAVMMISMHVHVDTRMDNKRCPMFKYKQFCLCILFQTLKCLLLYTYMNIDIKFLLCNNDSSEVTGSDVANKFNLSLEVTKACSKQWS